MKRTQILTPLLAAAVLAGATQISQAGVIPYGMSGTENPTTYSFTATSSGDLVGYFAGSTAAYDEQVGLLVNGVLTPAGYGLDDHSSSVGDSFDFGFVNAGDTLVFVDQITDGPPIVPSYVYSESSLNAPYDGGTGANHIYSTDATAGQVSSLIPAGTYVAFEDLPAGSSDWNYFDDTFVFTDVTTSAVPEPTTCAAGALMLLPFGLSMVRTFRKNRQA